MNISTNNQNGKQTNADRRHKKMKKLMARVKKVENKCVQSIKSNLNQLKKRKSERARDRVEFFYCKKWSKKKAGGGEERTGFDWQTRQAVVVIKWSIERFNLPAKQMLFGVTERISKENVPTNRRKTMKEENGEGNECPMGKDWRKRRAKK